MDKKELYDQAKEAYYNGEPIMTDLEFDELEKELGLENQGYVGTHHQKSYTVEHPFIMGSISKVQVKESEDHSIDWSGFQERVLSFLKKSNHYLQNGWSYEATPKYDGCSWEAVVDSKGNLVSVSTRGDGEYGKDIKVWFMPEWKKNYEPFILDYFKTLDEQSYFFLKSFVIRGECLIKRSIFEKKYAKEFTLPRSFVSGVLGQDWEGTDRQLEMREDLSWVAYDFREVYENGTIVEIGYTDRENCVLNIGERPDFFITGERINLKYLYDTFDHYRKNGEYALDGFVIKPGVDYRLQDGGRARQEDCVAVKFLPEIVDAELIGVEWNVGKTGEYYPTGILADVILGGKNVNRVSLSNYGKIVENKIGIGSKLKISLAGDIIPFVYQVVSEGEQVSVPEDSYVDGSSLHLMKRMSDRDKTFIKFINSVNVLKPDGIGEKVAEKLFEIYQTDNIVNFMFNDYWKEKLDDSKSSQNIIKSLEERKKTLTLPDLIRSMGYENCGEKNALYLAKKFSGLKVDTKGVPASIIELGESKDFDRDVSLYVLALDLESMKEENASDKIPVILTGSPKECGYNTKADFLAQHPEYVETTKWDECKILFTDDLNSTSSKMDKAKKKGIEIKRYI